MGGWTYLDYMSQPQWFLDMIKIKRDCEIKKSQDIKIIH